VNDLFWHRLFVAAVLVSFLTFAWLGGWTAGKSTSDAWHYRHQIPNYWDKRLICDVDHDATSYCSTTLLVCSDSKVRWFSRDDGMCYAEDKPR